MKAFLILTVYTILFLGSVAWQRSTETVIEYRDGKVTPIVSRAVAARPYQLQREDKPLNERQIFEVTRARMQVQIALANYQNAELAHELLISKIKLELGVPADYLFVIETSRFVPPPEPKPPTGGRP
jgi:hypothetical protein